MKQETSTIPFRLVDLKLIKQLFKKFSDVYGNLWTSRHKVEKDWEDCAKTWLDGLHEFEFPILKTAVAEAISIYAEYPPTLPQLINLCLRKVGIPTLNEIIQALIRRDFNMPVVKMIYEQLDTFVLIRATEDDLRIKVSALYKKIIAENKISVLMLEHKKNEEKMIRSFEDLKETEKNRIIRPDPVAPKTPWVSEVKNGQPRAALESPLKIWYMEQKQKKTKGLPNELDDNENKWKEKISNF